MKKSELTSFIKEEILSSLEEATIETSPQNLSKVKSQAKDDDVIKVVEANISLSDLQDIGYDDGEYAFDKYFNKSILKNIPDTQAYSKGFIQAIIDSAGSSRLNEAKFKVVEASIDPQKLEDLGYSTGEKALMSIDDEIFKHPNFDSFVSGFMKGFKDNLEASQDYAAHYYINEDEDDDLDAKAIKQAKGARRKHKKLDIALKSLKSITAEMKSLAREYSKADGVEKEKIKDKLKKKTPIKKELEAMVAKLEKNVV